MNEEGRCNIANADRGEHREWALKIKGEKAREVVVSTVTGMNVFALI